MSARGDPHNSMCAVRVAGDHVGVCIEPSVSVLWDEVTIASCEWVLWMVGDEIAGLTLVLGVMIDFALEHELTTVPTLSSIGFGASVNSSDASCDVGSNTMSPTLCLTKGCDGMHSPTVITDVVFR